LFVDSIGGRLVKSITCDDLVSEQAHPLLGAKLTMPLPEAVVSRGGHRIDIFAGAVDCSMTAKASRLL
jgi:hypothetical protein